MKASGDGRRCDGWKRLANRDSKSSACRALEGGGGGGKGAVVRDVSDVTEPLLGRIDEPLVGGWGMPPD